MKKLFTPSVCSLLIIAGGGVASSYSVAASNYNPANDDLKTIFSLAYTNAQALAGFKKDDQILDIDTNGKVTHKKATDSDIQADPLNGVGVIEAVVENSDVINDHSDNLVQLNEGIVKVANNLNKTTEAVDKNTKLLNTHSEVIDEIGNLTNENSQAIADLEQTQVYQDLAKVRAWVENKAEKSELVVLSKEFKRGLAAQAALNGLFQPYSIGKANVTAAFGGYKKYTAVAIGTGYRFNENFAAKAGVAFTKGSTTYNTGVNFEW